MFYSIFVNSQENKHFSCSARRKDKVQIKKNSLYFYEVHLLRQIPQRVPYFLFLITLGSNKQKTGKLN